MRTIIAGSRGITVFRVICQAMFSIPWKPTVVLSGTAEGVDRLGERWANMNNIPIEQYPADWGKYGKRAGFRRNWQMAEKADALVAIWDGKSRGTAHMIRVAREKKLQVYVVRYMTLADSKIHGRLPEFTVIDEAATITEQEWNNLQRSGGPSK